MKLTLCGLFSQYCQDINILKEYSYHLKQSCLPNYNKGGDSENLKYLKQKKKLLIYNIK